ncbi:MAG: hypothetical protein RMK89_11010, partial [Armatimonadota bacterium]|nr:hypothetical protein [Armatimonadota bacterium]MDW8143979.1 hypothetical protein [Armatimonadota bacterium]
SPTVQKHLALIAQPFILLHLKLPLLRVKLSQKSEIILPQSAGASLSGKTPSFFTPLAMWLSEIV